jgi:hypothetical protein
MEFQPLLLQSIEKLQYQTTPGELSTQTGLPLATVERDLQQLAIAVGGHLQVSNAGDVIYKYPQDFRNILRQKFLWLQVKEWLQVVWRVAFYLVRISFGLLLIASLVIIVLSILAISIASLFSDNNDGIDFGGIDWGGSDGGNFIWVWFDWGGSPSSAPSPRRKRRQKMNFLAAVYSFLFGDGNPNANLEEIRWRNIAQVIRKNRGAIAVEQVAPYLDEASLQSEDRILPVLLRFNGMPEVSPLGDLVYRFPDVQTLSQQQKFKHVQPYLKEKLWKFSAASEGQIWGVGILAAANCGGALVLGSMLKGVTATGGLVAVVAGMYWALLLYAIGFIAIPVGRWLWLQWVNSKITARNQRRSQQMAQLTAGSADLQRKLKFAEQFQSEQIISAADLAYSTEEDLLSQEIDNAPQLPADRSNLP